MKQQSIGKISKENKDEKSLSPHANQNMSYHFIHENKRTALPIQFQQKLLRRPSTLNSKHSINIQQ